MVSDIKGEIALFVNFFILKTGSKYLRMVGTYEELHSFMKTIYLNR